MLVDCEIGGGITLHQIEGSSSCKFLQCALHGSIFRSPNDQGVRWEGAGIELDPSCTSIPSMKLKSGGANGRVGRFRYDSQVLSAFRISDSSVDFLRRLTSPSARHDCGSASYNAWLRQIE